MDRKNTPPPFRDDNLKEKIDRLCLFDDHFMTAVFNDIACSELLIRTVVDERLNIKSVIVQKELKNLHGRSVVLDILAESEDGKIINIEVQRQKKGDMPKRLRYYSSVTDSNLLAEGDDYSRLPDTRLIMFCEVDPFGKGYQMYQVERIVIELDRGLGDGSKMILVNGEIIDDSAVGYLVRDFHETDPDKMHYDVLRERARYLKKDEKGVKEMSGIFEEIREEGLEIGKAEGRAEGRAEARYETAIGMIKEKISYPIISKITHYDLDEVEKLAMEVREMEGKYSVSKEN